MNSIFGKINSQGSEKRPTAFAGTWYEPNPEKLRDQINHYMHTAEQDLQQTPDKIAHVPGFIHNNSISGKIVAAIAPHAGYMFSGRTAAYVYQKIKSQKVGRIFLLGPSHYVGIHGLALPAEKAFATPLGELPVDTDIIAELANFPLFSIASDIHKREHSLEMQLPFIRQTFGALPIVPIIVGILDEKTEAPLVAQILKRYLKNDDLILVSSDFTHYGPNYDYQPFTQNVPAQIKQLDEQAFSTLSKIDLRSFVDFRDRTKDTICGYYPCCILLSLLPPQTKATLLNYRTSRDIPGGDNQNSVSYMALVFSTDEPAIWKKTEAVKIEEHKTISTADKAALLHLARQTLTDFVTGKNRQDAAMSTGGSALLHEPRGVFVTLYKHPHAGAPTGQPDKELRGCIGYIQPLKPLAQAVVENTIAACSRDPRFASVTSDELGDIWIDINVLTPLKSVQSYNDIVLGRDGIVLYKAGRQAVFLPSVATEFGWTLPETLSQLSLKAGLHSSDWMSGAKFDVFQSESFSEPTK